MSYVIILIKKVAQKSVWFYPVMLTVLLLNFYGLGFFSDPYYVLKESVTVFKLSYATVIYSFSYFHYFF